MPIQDDMQRWPYLPSIPPAGETPYYRYLRNLLFLPENVAIGSEEDVLYSPIEIPNTLTIDGIGAIWGNPGPNNFQVGIYNQVNEAPTTLIVASAVLATIGVHTKQLAAIVPTRLTKGLYYIGFKGDNAGQNVWGAIALALSEGQIPPGNINNGPAFYYEVVGAGWLPAVATPVFRTRAVFHFVRVLSIP